MYSGIGTERPETESGACEFGGRGFGKMVEITPVEDRARRRRARRVVVNQEGYDCWFGGLFEVGMMVSLSILVEDSTDEEASDDSSKLAKNS